jgi:hypothetical protein
MPKVAKCSIVADEAVVTKISERAGVMPPQAKGFTWYTFFTVLQPELCLGMILGKEQKLKCITVKSPMNREVHVLFCERFRGETLPLSNAPKKYDVIQFKAHQ